MFLTNFEKCEWCAAFLDSCASDKRYNQIQNKLVKKYYDHLSFFANTPFKALSDQVSNRLDRGMFL